jgi:hypothetical protein
MGRLRTSEGRASGTKGGTVTAALKPLYAIAADMAMIADLLVENNGEITPEIAELLATVPGDFREKLARCAVVAKNMKAEMEKHAAEAEIQAVRAATLKRSFESMKGYMKREMEAAGQLKVEGVARIQNNSQPSIAWTKPVEELPEEYRRVTIVANIRRAQDALDIDGTLPDGFVVEHGNHLRLI